MPRRRSLRGVLRGFLGSFTSRYSDYEGYWIFGMLVMDLREATIDLLGDADGGAEPGPLSAAFRLARTLFGEQLGKGGLDPSRVREARLDMRRSSTPTRGTVNGRLAEGYEITLAVRVVTDLNGVYESTGSIFVAPHDPQAEQRSRRGAR
jgi:hypothetical protein